MWRAATRALSRCARSSWWLSLVGLVALIAAFMATKGGGRSGPAPRSAAKRPERSGGWREPAILLRDVKRPLGGATENSRLPPLRGRTACRRVALSRRPWARPLRQQGNSEVDGTSLGRSTNLIPCSRLKPRAQEPATGLRGGPQAEHGRTRV